jgi:serine/threonine protein kinase
VSLVEGDVVVRAEARVGSVLRGKYRLERVLGVGGMASVYSATHRNSKRFAVKILHPELSLQSDVRVRFLREGYAANQVKHPGAVAVLDDDVSEDGLAFLVMELLEGQTVDALWEKFRWKLPTGAVLAVAHQLLDVLAAAHDSGIIHRDIKPENLFLTAEGQVKVLDFGIARLKDVANSTVTGAGFVMGTPSFMAPEQALGKSKEIDAQSDVWSAGAVFFSLLSGRFVHEGESSQEIVVQCATEPARSLARVLPDAPREIVQLIDSALAFKKASRWATAMAMRKGVEAAAYATLGSGPSRGALLKLFTDTARPSDSSNPYDGVDPRTIANKVKDPALHGAPTGEEVAVEVLAASSSTGSHEPAPPQPEPARTVGRTTDQPVARDSIMTPGWLLRKRLAWAAGIGIAVVTALVLVASHGKSTDVPSIGPASATTSIAPPTPTTTPNAIPTSVSATSASASTPSATTAPTSTRAPTPTPTSQPPHTPPVRPPTAATPAAPNPAPAIAPAANCTPPFTIDPATGKKKWKAECL